MLSVLSIPYSNCVSRFRRTEAGAWNAFGRTTSLYINRLDGTTAVGDDDGTIAALGVSNEGRADEDGRLTMVIYLTAIP